MGFTSAVSGQTVFGDKKIVFGTFTNTDGGTGGDVATGLTSCEFFVAQCGGGTADKAAAVNETYPVAGGAMTIVTAADVDGYWFAFGK